MAVRTINEQLSHPEQVKRWVVCAQPLTIAAGELTPNLKIRRSKVLEARSALVDGVYDSWEDVLANPDAVEALHGGEA